MGTLASPFGRPRFFVAWCPLVEHGHALVASSSTRSSPVLPAKPVAPAFIRSRFGIEGVQRPAQQPAKPACGSKFGQVLRCGSKTFGKGHAAFEDPENLAHGDLVGPGGSSAGIPPPRPRNRLDEAGLAQLG